MKRLTSQPALRAAATCATASSRSCGARRLEVVLLLVLADAVPDHDVPHADLERPLDAARVPGDVQLEREAAAA